MLYNIFQTKPKHYLQLDDATEAALTSDKNMKNDLFPDNASKARRKKNLDLNDLDDDGVCLFKSYDMDKRLH